MNIHLSTQQELRAARVGFERQHNAVSKEYPPRHRGGSLWGGHIEGACAELAVANALGLPWTGEAFWESPPAERLADVGEKIEVRWVAPRPDPCLNFDDERDSDERFYVLVSGYAPSFTIHGSIQGANARRPMWRREYPERVVYRVPAEALLPFIPREQTA